MVGDIIRLCFGEISTLLRNGNKLAVKRIFLMAFFPFLNFVFLNKCMLKETPPQKRRRSLSEKVLEESAGGPAQSLLSMHARPGRNLSPFPRLYADRGAHDLCSLHIHLRKCLRRPKYIPHNSTPFLWYRGPSPQLPLWEGAHRCEGSGREETESRLA